MENTPRPDLLSGINAVFHDLGDSLSGRDAHVAETAARVWDQLNTELVRLAPQIDALEQERDEALSLLRECRNKLDDRVNHTCQYAMPLQPPCSACALLKRIEALCKASGAEEEE